ncbi:sialidase-1 [Propionicimonas paludicola]|uniref:exo-alpha-sialidase n=1 Tax=Propionicimonas paludicola TaxID=185243 RepID=A0A2A9CXN1_9ACTN|nr:exo-alpha-sialidase [Propionicimonas paludicola]PFG18360.1 sialidase-1 [Propionicimonas paludicola]
MKKPPDFHLKLQLAVSLAVATAAFGLPVVLNPGTAAAAAPQECSSTPFTSKSATRYRVPAVVRVPDGRLFVFAEKRNDNADNDDDGDFDIAMKTSTDGGCTWGGEKIVADHGKLRVSNPVPVYVPARDKVLLITTVKTKDSSARTGYRNYMHQQWIDTDGGSFTSLTSGRVTVPNWRPGLTGPGHGIVLTKGSHAGRIIFAMGYTENDKRTARGVYSDDNGATWQIGYDRAASGKQQLIEGSIAELPDGRLLTAYRDNGKGVSKPGSNRMQAYSTNGGESIGSFSLMSGVKTVPVEGSLLQTTGGRELLLFSSPSNTSFKITSRRGMRIFVSTNNGQSWRSGLAVGSTTDPACYSDMVQLDAGTIGLVYENGYSPEKAYWNRIVFRQVSVSDLEQTLLPSLAKKKSPSVSGTHKVGKTVTASQGTWSPNATVTRYQWLRNGKEISSATSASYKLSKADKGKKVSVKVTVTSPGYQPSTATSSAKKVK